MLRSADVRMSVPLGRVCPAEIKRRTHRNSGRKFDEPPSIISLSVVILCPRLISSLGFPFLFLFFISSLLLVSIQSCCFFYSSCVSNMNLSLYLHMSVSLPVSLTVSFTFTIFLYLCLSLHLVVYKLKG